jgi:hypothetical protein
MRRRLFLFCVCFGPSAFLMSRSRDNGKKRDDGNLRAHFMTWYSLFGTLVSDKQWPSETELGG